MFHDVQSQGLHQQDNAGTLTANGVRLRINDRGATVPGTVIGEGSCAIRHLVPVQAGRSDIVYVGLESYILKTTNGGETWEEIIIAPGRFFFGIAINPSMPSRVYAASWFTTDKPQPLILYISDDGGDSWQEIVEENVRFGGAFDLLHVSDGNTDKLYLALWKGGVYEFKTDVTMAIGMQNVTKPITMLQNVRELVR